MREAIAAGLMIGMMLAGPAEAAGRSDERALAAGRPVGKPLDCVPINQLRQSRVRSDRVIDFYTTGNRVYRNTLPYACPRLNVERAFAYATSLNRLCSVDIITVISSSGMPGGTGPSCGLGQFQQMTGVPR